jgi:hypothetical protein
VLLRVCSDFIQCNLFFRIRLGYIAATARDGFTYTDTPNKKAVAKRAFGIAHLNSDRILASQKINNSSADFFRRRCAIPYRCECRDGQSTAASRSLTHHAIVDRATLET